MQSGCNQGAIKGATQNCAKKHGRASANPTCLLGTPKCLLSTPPPTVLAQHLLPSACLAPPARCLLSTPYRCLLTFFRCLLSTSYPVLAQHLLLALAQRCLRVLVQHPKKNPAPTPPQRQTLVVLCQDLSPHTYGGLTGNEKKLVKHNQSKLCKIMQNHVMPKSSKCKTSTPGVIAFFQRKTVRKRLFSPGLTVGQDNNSRLRRPRTAAPGLARGADGPAAPSKNFDYNQPLIRKGPNDYSLCAPCNKYYKYLVHVPERGLRRDWLPVNKRNEHRRALMRRGGQPLSVEGVSQMVYILPERLLTLVRPAFDLVLRRIRSLKRCVQA